MFEMITQWPIFKAAAYTKRAKQSQTVTVMDCGHIG